MDLGLILLPGSGGGATVTTDDNAPTSPQDGDLWWKSDEGRLKVYYADPNSSQWVDASPPLANTTIASGNSTVLVVSTSAGVLEDAIEFWGGNAKKWRMTQGGDLLPTADGQYDIGSSSYKVKDLYLDATSLHIGSVDLSESAGSLVVPPLQLTGHVIPDTNAVYDLGTAEKKFVIYSYLITLSITKDLS